MAMTHRDNLVGAGLMELMRRTEKDNAKRLKEIKSIFGDGVEIRVANAVYEQDDALEFADILKAEGILIEPELQ